MFSQLFLDYLREQNVLTDQQVHDVADRRRTAKVHIGTLALSSGLMTQEQIENVNNLQASIDKRFGEIAVMKGYITQEQFSEILNLQPKEHMYLSQVLTDWGLMNFDDFISHATELQAFYDLDDEQFARLIDNDAYEYVKSIAKIDDRHGLLLEYAVMFVKAVSRLIDRDVLVMESYETTALKFDSLVYQPCECGHVIYSCFSPDPGDAMEFAQRYVKTPLNGDIGYAAEVFKEFLNCVNGLLITHLSDENIAEIDIDVPLNAQNGTIRSERSFRVMPFRLPFGEFSIFLVEREYAAIDTD